MQNKKQPSGLDKVPPIFTRPLWKGRFFWIFIATAIFWLAIFRYFVW